MSVMNTMGLSHPFHTSTEYTTVNGRECVAFPMDEARSELFYPTQACNRQSTDLCHQLAEKLGSRVFSEMEDPKKSLRLHLSKCDGKFSKKMTSERRREWLALA